MSKIGELVYLVLDELKITSDDAFYTEEHILFLLDKYRSLILKQRYGDPKKDSPDSNYQEICLDLELVNIDKASPCEDDFFYMKSTEPVPSTLSIGIPKIYTSNYISSMITYVSKDRMPYVGYNDFLSKIIYATKDSGDYLILKAASELPLTEIRKVKFYAAFSDVKEAYELSCSDKDIDLMEKDYPIEDALVPDLIRAVIQELLPAVYRPEDNNNNSHDDLSGIPTK